MSLKAIRELLRNNVYIALNGIICDRRERHFSPEIVSEIPLDRLMLETDSPYLMPRNVPGQWGANWRNEPCLIPFIVKRIVHVRGDCTETEVAMKSTEVAKMFFGM